MNKYESMRTNQDNWKLGIVYYCKQDPRVIVRQLLPFGWTWNFAHSHVYLAIVSAILIFSLPVVIAYYLGLRDMGMLGLMLALSLCVIMVISHELSKPPKND